MGKQTGELTITSRSVYVRPKSPDQLVCVREQSGKLRFPGGGVDLEDYPAPDNRKPIDRLVEAIVNAAIREVDEEANDITRVVGLYAVIGDRDDLNRFHILLAGEYLGGGSQSFEALPTELHTPAALQTFHESNRGVSAKIAFGAAAFTSGELRPLSDLPDLLLAPTILPIQATEKLGQVAMAV